MDLPSYEKVVHDIRTELHHQLKRKEEDVKFATRKLAKDVLTNDKLGRVYKSLQSPEELHLSKASEGLLSSRTVHSQPSSSADSENEGSFIRKVEEKKLHDFLAVLIYARCTKSAAQSFKAKLVFTNEPNTNLPASKLDLKTWFGEEGTDVDDFLSCQKHFCTIVIGCPEDLILQAGGSWSMPWLSEEPLGRGSFGRVVGVKIAEHHFTENGKLNDTSSEPKVIARKIFPMKEQASFKTEVQVMKEIRDNPNRHNNILKSFGTLIIQGDKPEFSLFMPKAKTDLKQYLESNNGGVPFSLEERKNLIDSAIGLADGLDFLHTGMTPKRLYRRVCFHMDLKPDNVLIFREDHCQHDIWKISDFGMSKVKDIPFNTPTQDDTLTDFEKLFNRRPKTVNVGASNTIVARAPSAFLPSEGEERGKKAMNEKGDVWALGCILSVAFTYMEFPAQGLEEYVALRRQHSHLDPPKDVFYSKNTIRRSFPINKGVIKQHEALVKAAAEQGSAEARATKYMLKFLEHRVFVESQDKRCAASEVSQKLQRTLQMYEAVPGSNAGGTEERPRLLNLIPGFKKASGTTVCPEFVSWRLNKYKATRAKGCDCSPDGVFIAYWDEDEIMLFTKSHGLKQELSPVDKEGRKPDDSDRVWKAIKLTNRYLIAITTGSEHNCYIFDMVLAVTLTIYTVLSLPESETSLLDVSPDLRSFMCIRKSSDGRSLFYSSKIQPFIGCPNQPEEPTAYGQKKIEANISTIEQSDAWLSWRATDILRIISHSKNRGYVAFQNQHNSLLLSIAFFCVDARSHIEARLNETNFFGETASLFTDMVCTSNDSTGTQVLVVLHTKRISQVGFTDLKTKAKISAKSPIDEYRILSLTIDQSSGKIIALGVRSLYNNVCLLEIKWLTDDPFLKVTKRLAVLEKLLEADEPKVRICQEAGQRIALITALTSNDRSAVYQVSLDGLSRD